MALKIPSVSGGIDKVSRLKLAGVPVGKVLVLGPAIGLMEAVNTAITAAIGVEYKPIERFNVVPLATGLGLGFGLNKIPQLKKALGDTGTEALVVGSLLTGLNQSIHLTGYARYYVARAAALLGAKDPWTIAGMSETDWYVISEIEVPADRPAGVAQSVASTSRKAALERSGLAGEPSGSAAYAPIPVGMRTGIAEPRPDALPFESAPALAGAPAAGSINAVNEVIGNIKLPSPM